MASSGKERAKKVRRQRTVVACGYTGFRSVDVRIVDRPDEEDEVEAGGGMVFCYLSDGEGASLGRWDVSKQELAESGVQNMLGFRKYQVGAAAPRGLFVVFHNAVGCWMVSFLQGKLEGKTQVTRLWDNPPGHPQLVGVIMLPRYEQCLLQFQGGQFVLLELSYDGTNGMQYQELQVFDAGCHCLFTRAAHKGEISECVTAAVDYDGTLYALCAKTGHLQRVFIHGGYTTMQGVGDVAEIIRAAQAAEPKDEKETTDEESSAAEEVHTNESDAQSDAESDTGTSSGTSSGTSTGTSSAVSDESWSEEESSKEEAAVEAKEENGSSSEEVSETEEAAAGSSTTGSDTSEDEEADVESEDETEMHSMEWHGDLDLKLLDVYKEYLLVRFEDENKKKARHAVLRLRAGTALIEVVGNIIDDIDCQYVASTRPQVVGVLKDSTVMNVDLVDPDGSAPVGGKGAIAFRPHTFIGVCVQDAKLPNKKTRIRDYWTELKSLGTFWSSLEGAEVIASHDGAALVRKEDGSCVVVDMRKEEVHEIPHRVERENVVFACLESTEWRAEKIDGHAPEVTSDEEPDKDDDAGTEHKDDTETNTQPRMVGVLKVCIAEWGRPAASDAEEDADAVDRSVLFVNTMDAGASMPSLTHNYGANGGMGDISAACVEVLPGRFTVACLREESSHHTLFVHSPGTEKPVHTEAGRLKGFGRVTGMCQTGENLTYAVYGPMGCCIASVSFGTAPMVAHVIRSAAQCVYMGLGHVGLIHGRVLEVLTMLEKTREPESDKERALRRAKGIPRSDARELYVSDTVTGLNKFQCAFLKEREDQLGSDCVLHEGSGALFWEVPFCLKAPLIRNWSTILADETTYEWSHGGRDPAPTRPIEEAQDHTVVHDVDWTKALQEESGEEA